MRKLLFAFSLLKIYIPHLYHYVLFYSYMQSLIGIELFSIFCKFKEKIRKRRAIVQNAMRATYRLQNKGAMP